MIIAVTLKLYQLAYGWPSRANLESAHVTKDPCASNMDSKHCYPDKGGVEQASACLGPCSSSPSIARGAYTRHIMGPGLDLNKIACLLPKRNRGLMLPKSIPSCMLESSMPITRGGRSTQPAKINGSLVMHALNVNVFHKAITCCSGGVVDTSIGGSTGCGTCHQLLLMGALARDNDTPPGQLRSRGWPIFLPPARGEGCSGLACRRIPNDRRLNELSLVV